MYKCECDSELRGAAIESAGYDGPVGAAANGQRTLHRALSDPGAERTLEPREQREPLRRHQILGRTLCKVLVSLSLSLSSTITITIHIIHSSSLAYLSLKVMLKIKLDFYHS